jgi:exopolysaccharide biosynthesis polyprenyl glycosylphosphotransferase
VIQRFSLRYNLFIRASDAVIVVVALFAATWLRQQIELGKSAPDEAFVAPQSVLLLIIIIWQFIFHVAGVYKPYYSAWLASELQRIISAHGMASLIFFGVLYLTFRDFSRLQSIYFIALALIMFAIFRVSLRIVKHIVRKPLAPERNVLVVGTDANAERVGKTISLYNWTGLTLCGYVTQNAQDTVFPDIHGNVLGNADDLPQLVERYKASEVIIAVKMPEPAFVSQLMDLLQNHPINIRLAPDYSDLAYFHVRMENFGGLPLIGLRDAVLSPTQRLAKRLFDISVSLIALTLGWPVFCVVALAIKLENQGPIIFKQQRIGERGRPFTMYKFRSMYADADKMSVPEDADHKKRNDPRVTKVGRFIRRTSLDELPQFVNILRGDMSLVGPRPEMPWLVSQYSTWQRKRFEVPQGLTGWWQVTGRAEKPMYLNTEDDLFYIQNYSLWLDMQIIFRTILTVFTGRGAF